MAAFEFKEEEKSGIPIISVSGYFNADAAAELTTMVKSRLEKGFIRLALEFSGCTACNSPGVATLMDIAILVSDDYHGQLVFCELDDTKRSFFRMVGIFTASSEVTTKDDAVLKLSKK